MQSRFGQTCKVRRQINSYGCALSDSEFQITASLKVQLVGLEHYFVGCTSQKLDKLVVLLSLYSAANILANDCNICGYMPLRRLDISVVVVVVAAAAATAAAAV